MAASLPTLAEAVAQALNAAGGWSMPFTAERAWQPTLDLRDVSTVRVTVVGTRVDSARAARGLWEQVYTVEVGVQSRTEEFSTAELDALAGLAEEIARHWEDNPELQAGSRRYVCVGANCDFVNFEDLERLRQFTSVVALSFKAWR